MRIRLSALLSSLLLLATLPLGGGCGGEEQTAPDAGSPETYFGLQLGRCLEYTTGDSASTSPALGMVVEAIDDKQFAVPTHVIAYYNGRVAMRDYVAFQGNALVLHKREFPGGPSYIYDPPLKRLEMPVRASSTLNASSAVTIRDKTGNIVANKEAHDLRVDVFAAKEIALPIGQTVTATQIMFTEKKTSDGSIAGRPEFVVFTPATEDRSAAKGFVEIDFNFELDPAVSNLTYKLQKVRDLGSTPKQASPVCGGTP